MTSIETHAYRTDTDNERAVVDRLVVEFRDSVPSTTIARVVSWSIGDLAGVPAADIPELAERVARQRLLTALQRIATWVPQREGTL